MYVHLYVYRNEYDMKNQQKTDNRLLGGQNKEIQERKKFDWFHVTYNSILMFSELAVQLISL